MRQIDKWYAAIVYPFTAMCLAVTAATGDVNQAAGVAIICGILLVGWAVGKLACRAADIRARRRV